MPVQHRIDWKLFLAQVAWFSEHLLFAEVVAVPRHWNRGLFAEIRCVTNAEQFERYLQDLMTSLF